MPEPTPRSAGREPLEGSRFLSDVLADKVRAYRLLRRLKQEELAEDMRGLRHTTWSRQTVSEVERGRRNLTIDELAGLSLLLQVPLFMMLDPKPLEGGQPPALDVGAQVPIPANQARDWIYGRSIVLFRGMVGEDGKRQVQAVAIASAEEVAAEVEHRRELPPSRQLFAGPTPSAGGSQEGGDAS